MGLKKPAFLSIFLLTVMTNVAVTPLLGLISTSFPTAGITLAKQVIANDHHFQHHLRETGSISSQKNRPAIGLIIYSLGGFGSR